MASLLRRTIFLSLSRFANQAIMLLSPLLLVRILSVNEYGGYREFLLYATIIAPLVSFGIARALLFLLPKRPQLERVWITQTVLLVLAFSVVVQTGVFLASDLIRANTSFDFVFELQLYIFFFVNLDFVELYWLGKKRTDKVLYYSTTRMLARTVTVITAAYLTEDAVVVILCLIAVETIRFLLVLLFSIWRRWYALGITAATLRLQVSYFLPLGAGANIEILRSSAGPLFISVVLGPEALAFYMIGVFATKIADILRGAIADVIFPDMVEVKSTVPKDALPLWRRATVWYSILMFPGAVFLSYYADAVVITLFTSQYLAAVPVFATLALHLLLLCFDFHLPLRVQNANRFYVVGSLLALATSLTLLYPMYLAFGLVGPAVASLLAHFTMAAYLARQVNRIYAIRFVDIVAWREIGKVLLASLACLPILVLGKLLMENLILRGVLFGAAFFVAYYFLLRALAVSESDAIVRAFTRIKRWPRTAL